MNAGADDLLDNECSSLESLARIQAQIRCYRRLTGEEHPHLMKMDDLEAYSFPQSLYISLSYLVALAPDHMEIAGGLGILFYLLPDMTDMHSHRIICTDGLHLPDTLT